MKPGHTRPVLLPPPGPPLPPRGRIVATLDVRDVPMPHLGTPAGCCKWCGHMILTEDGALYTNRAMHLECSGVHAVATSSAQARVFAFERDAGVCASCGTDCTANLIGWRCRSSYCRDKRRAGEAWTPSSVKPCWDALEGDPGRGSSYGLGYTLKRWRLDDPAPGWCAVEPVYLAWHADHVVPLWLADPTDYPRCLRFWSLDNLQTLCEPCHREKTDIEAATRAKMKRQEAKFGSGGKRRDRGPVPF